MQQRVIQRAAVVRRGCECCSGCHGSSQSLCSLTIPSCPDGSSAPTSLGGIGNSPGELKGFHWAWHAMAVRCQVSYAMSAQQPVLWGDDWAVWCIQAGAEPYSNQESEGDRALMLQSIIFLLLHWHGGRSVMRSTDQIKTFLTQARPLSTPRSFADSLAVSARVQHDGNGAGHC